MFVDGLSNKRGGGVGLVLEGPSRVTVWHFLIFKFKVSNNHAKYEALITKLTLAKDLGVVEVDCKTNSQLVVSQIKDFDYHHVLS